MRKNTVELGRPQMTIWRLHIACWICKATNTHSQYVIHIAFPLQPCLHKWVSMLLYKYVACLVVYTDSCNWKACMTVGMSYIMLQAMLRISIYRVSQEESSIFWKVIVSVIRNINVYMNMCPIPNGFWDRAIWMYNRNIVDKKEILCVRTVSNTGIYCSSDWVGTVYNKCSKIPPSTSMHFATLVKTWRVVRLSASWRSFMQAITSSMLTSSSSCVYTFFCTLHSSSNPINKNLTGLSLEILVASLWYCHDRSTY